MKSLYRDFFEDKKILITGHTGFIGSWLTILMIELGAKVIGYALHPLTKGDNFVVTNLEEKITNIFADIRDFKEINSCFKKHHPDIVFHLAAQPIVRKSYLMPKETYDINVGGTVNVFEAYRKSDVCRLMINFTSDKCYENLELDRGYKEDDRLGGYDPYSSSKACSEIVTSAYRKSFFEDSLNQNTKHVSSVRCGNVIGGGDWQEDRLIPDCMKALRSNEDIIIRNPKFVRPWQYVLEPLRGLLSLSMKMWQEEEKYSGAWNFGPNMGEIDNVEDIIKRIINYLGIGNYKIQPQNKCNNIIETKFLSLDISKARKYLEWEPLFPIDKTIKFLCDWYMQDNVDYDFDVDQINKYFKQIKINSVL